MKTAKTLTILLLALLLAGFTLTGCTEFNGEDGAPGADGKRGPDGLDGATGDLPVPCLGCINTTSEDIAANSIVTDQIADLNVTTSDLAPLAVTRGKIANLAIDSTKLDYDAVTIDHIADDSITNFMVRQNAVRSDHILDGDILTIDLADGAVTDAKVTNVSGTKIDANSIDSAKIVSIDGSKIIAGTFDGSRITDNTISSVKIISLDASKIDASVNKIPGTSLTGITGAQITDGSIGTNDLALNGINGDRLMTDSVTYHKIGSIHFQSMTTYGYLPESNLPTNIDGDKIAANTLPANRIENYSLTATQVEPGAFTYVIVVNDDGITDYFNGGAGAQRKIRNMGWPFTLAQQSVVTIKFQAPLFFYENDSSRVVGAKLIVDGTEQARTILGSLARIYDNDWWAGSSQELADIWYYGQMNLEWTAVLNAGSHTVEAWWYTHTGISDARSATGRVLTIIVMPAADIEVHTGNP